uniref:Vacuolar protein sorting-associated protein 54 C-terminal domain-containing protein n=1 Tax=Lactuca sativa TaxID=4236 RepID=A0A9R1XRD3_LACSA|nr:hypothetical protein LSAT_V11C200079050 [Lactuca sativa]
MNLRSLVCKIFWKELESGIRIRTSNFVLEMLKFFNKRACQLVLGVGAMQVSGLKSTTSKHLALASQEVGYLQRMLSRTLHEADVQEMFKCARASYQLVHSEISPGLLEAITKHANMEYCLVRLVEYVLSKVMEELENHITSQVEPILKLRDMMIGWIHEGFQSFFRSLNDELLKQEGAPL